MAAACLFSRVFFRPDCAQRLCGKVRWHPHVWFPTMRSDASCIEWEPGVVLPRSKERGALINASVHPNLFGQIETVMVMMMMMKRGCVLNQILGRG